MEHWRRTMGVGCALGVAMFVVASALDTPPEGEQPDQPVAAVQALLHQERLYSGAVDGVMGSQTIAAIRRYQILHGLRATGRLDADTLRSMLGPLPSAPEELTAADRELLHELAQTPAPASPDAVAESRKPIPPGVPPAATPGNQKSAKDKAHKSGRSKAPKQRRIVTGTASGFER